MLPGLRRLRPTDGCAIAALIVAHPLVHVLTARATAALADLLGHEGLQGVGQGNVHHAPGVSADDGAKLGKIRSHPTDRAIMSADTAIDVTAAIMIARGFAIAAFVLHLADVAQKERQRKRAGHPQA